MEIGIALNRITSGLVFVLLTLAGATRLPIAYGHRRTAAPAAGFSVLPSRQGFVPPSTTTTPSLRPAAAGCSSGIRSFENRCVIGLRAGDGPARRSRLATGQGSSIRASRPDRSTSNFMAAVKHSSVAPMALPSTASWYSSDVALGVECAGRGAGSNAMPNLPRIEREQASGGPAISWSRYRHLPSGRRWPNPV